MTTAGQTITRRANRISVPAVLAGVAFAGGIALGIMAGRGFAGSQPTNLGSTTIGAVQQEAADVAGLAAYRTAEAGLRAALLQGDPGTAAHFRAQLTTLRTPAIVSALAHERVDIELGLASATTWHDPRMAAEFRSRLAAQAR